MAKHCEFCGKGPVVGRVYTRKGKPKREGGVGSHISRKSARRFMPNLQPARVLVRGVVRRILVCTKCLKKGRLLRAA